MTDDQLFLFADETVTHLEAALDKAKQLRELGRDRVQGKHEDAGTRKKLTLLARDLYSTVDDAGTAANAVWGEVQDA
jgi:hypothetical protein